MIIKISNRIFDDIFIQPAAGDAGGALGCAYIAWYQYLDNKRATDGKNDFIDLVGFSWGGEISISLWTKFESPKPWARIFEFGDAYPLN